MKWKFANNLKFLRAKHGIEQSQIADMLDKKSTSAVSEWEKGLRLPSVGELDTLANYFGFTIDELVKKDIQENEIRDQIKISINLDDPFSELKIALDKMRERNIIDINQLTKVEYDYLKNQADYCMNAYLYPDSDLNQNPSD